MTRLFIGLLIVTIAHAGCSRGLPFDPDRTAGVQQQASAVVTVSGQIYQRTDWADPPLADAVVQLQEPDGSLTSVFSDADGFYTLSARTGRVKLTASKEGHGSKTQDLTLSKDTVLNFSLDPES
jgi:hypothetical protein